MIFGLFAKRGILLIFVIICKFRCFYCETAETEGETILEEFLICRSCGSDAALSNFIISKISSKPLIVSHNETIFGKTGVTVQVIENPLRVRFEVITLSRLNCAKIGIWNKSFSWFQGYAWKVCLCPKCAAHLGWMFEPFETATKNQIFPSEKGFYLLVIDSVIAEKEIKSFLPWLNITNPQ